MADQKKKRIVHCLSSFLSMLLIEFTLMGISTLLRCEAFLYMGKLGGGVCQGPGPALLTHQFCLLADNRLYM